jgi:hypothetical protein
MINEKMTSRTLSTMAIAVVLPTQASIYTDATIGKIKSNTTLNLHQGGDEYSESIQFSNINGAVLREQLSIGQEGFINIVVRADGCFNHDLDNGFNSAAWASVTALLT